MKRRFLCLVAAAAAQWADGLVPPAGAACARQAMARASSLRPQDDFKAEREQTVRDSFNRIRVLKKQGRRYDGSAMSEAELAALREEEDEVDEEDEEDDGDELEEGREAVVAEDEDAQDADRQDLSDEVKEILKIKSFKERTRRLEALKQQGPVALARDADSDEGLTEEEVVAKLAARLRQKAVNSTKQAFAERQGLIAEELASSQTAVQPEETVLAASEQTTEADRRTTTGVGGAWTPPESSSSEEEGQGGVDYQPKVSTWGVFPRPKDISKAYGGGRRVGVGAPGYNESQKAEPRKVDVETERYMANQRREAQLVKENEALIEATIAKGQRLFGMGRYTDAVTVIENVTQAYCTPTTRIGARALLELAMAKDGAGNVTGAVALYRDLANCPHFDIAKNAKMLSYRVKAQRELTESGIKFNAEIVEGLAMDKYEDLLVPASERRTQRWRQMRASGQISRSPSMYDALDFEITDQLLAAFMAVPLVPIVGVLFVIIQKQQGADW